MKPSIDVSSQTYHNAAGSTHCNGFLACAMLPGPLSVRMHRMAALHWHPCSTIPNMPSGPGRLLQALHTLRWRNLCRPSPPPALRTCLPAEPQAP